MESEQYLDYLILVNHLFDRWKLHFQSKLKERQVLDLKTAKMWAVALMMMQVTEQEMESAFAVSITKLWPPTTPADLLEPIRGSEVSPYPDAYTAYQQAANGNYLHPVCKETAKRLGTWELKSQAESITQPKWQRIYKQVCLEYSVDSAKFNQIHAAIESKYQSDTKVLYKPRLSLEEQSAIATAALKKIREII